MIKTSKRIALILCMFVLAAQAPVASAADLFSDEGSRISNGIFFYNPADVCGTPSDQAPIAAVTDGGPNAETILRFFVGKGLTLAAAAGFAGNMKQESGLNSKIVQGVETDSGFEPSYDAEEGVDIMKLTYVYKGEKKQKGFGLVQWTSTGRKQGLATFAAGHKLPVIDLSLQLEYVWQELNSTYKVSTLNKVKAMTDPVEAAIVVHDNYEISADSDSDVRRVRGGNAQGYYDQFKGKITESAIPAVSTGTTTETVDVTDEGTCNTDQVDLTGGVGEANGLTFPLMTTKEVINKGINGAIWHPQECQLGPGQGSAGNCHHDYNAADIFAPTGTKIIAAKPGRVVSKSTGSCDYHGCNVSVKGDDGLLYYYTHMSKHATVNVNQKVQSGQELGRVGTDATAMDTPRHLHFDITRGNSRPSCSGASCNDADFINVQPILIPAFNNLPSGGATADV